MSDGHSPPDAIYGRPLSGRRVTAVPTHLAQLFARAHQLVFHRPAGVHIGDGIVTVADEPTLQWQDPPEDLVDRVRAARRPVLLAGPGVIRDRSVPGLHALAAVAHVGVLNTWEAKGVFDWRSRHHLASAGLQENDFALGGLADADLIVATGIDSDDPEAHRWQLADFVAVEPSMLDPLSEHWFRPACPIEKPPLRVGLARVTQAGWASTTIPIAPTLATRGLGSVIGRDGLLAADAGLSGFWVARTFATTGPGTVVVAPSPAPGLAIACAAVARLRNPERAVLAVVDGPATDSVREVLDASASAGAFVGVEYWQPDGRRLTADEHATRLHALARCITPTEVTLATDVSQLDPIVEIAGPIVVWPDLDMRRF